MNRFFIKKKKTKQNFWPCHTACEILVPSWGIEPKAPALEAQGLNHQIAKEVPGIDFYKIIVLFNIILWFLSSLIFSVMP